MTIIAYNKGVLATDTRALHDTGSAGSFGAVQVVKLKVLSRNTFAVAVSGAVPSDEGWKHIDEVFFKVLIKMEVLIPCHQLLLSAKDLQLINSTKRNFIVVTRNHVYYMNFSSEKDPDNNGLTRLNKGDKIAFGSGAHCAYTAMCAGMDGLQAVEFTSTVEATTGGPFASINRKDLTAFTDVSSIFTDKLISFKKRLNKRLTKQGEKA